MNINPKIYKISGNTYIIKIFDAYMFAILQDGYS